MLTMSRDIINISPVVYPQQRQPVKQRDEEPSSSAARSARTTRALQACPYEIDTCDGGSQRQLCRADVGLR